MAKPSTTPAPTSTVTVRMVVIGVIAVLALIFVFQNSSTGTLHLFFWEVSAPGWIGLGAVFLAGVLVGSVFPWFRRRSART